MAKKRDTALSDQRHDLSWQAIDAKVGGRKGLLEAALMSADPKAVQLAELLMDPALKNAGTKALAKRAGLSAPEIVDLYRNRMWLEATLSLYSKLPEIVDGAATDAAPSMQPCPECKTTKVSASGDICWVCGGSGEVRKSGDRDKLNFVGEAAGIIKKGGPAIQINNQQINTGGGNESFEALLRRAQIPPPRKQVEAQEAEVILEGTRDETKTN